MSIPRLAIHRPVTMFMISFVVILLGAISLTRLPVDLMPESEFPSITVRVNYSGVGPLEIEELVTRPVEQAVSAIAGLEQVNSTSSEGNSQVRLQFAWGTDLNEAADEVRTRVDRVRGRLPEDADAPNIFKFDSGSHFIGRFVEVGAPRKRQPHHAAAFRRRRIDLLETRDRGNRLLERAGDQFFHLERADARVVDAHRDAGEFALRHQVDGQARQRDGAQQHHHETDHEHRHRTMNG